MCLVALALAHCARFPLVLATNRDEFFARATAPLAWWTAEAGGVGILGGRDLEAGGTWLGLTAAGRLALVTNVRDPSRQDPQAPSRGHVVPQWLGGRESPERFWARIGGAGHNGFNLLAFDFPAGDAFFASNHGGGPQPLAHGLHGLSNASLDTPWPKVVALKARLRQAVETAACVDALASALFAALADSHEAPPAQLPRTGVAPDLERQLSPAFIRIPGRGYGTRSSLLVIAEPRGAGCVTHVLERRFDRDGHALATERVELPDWPPRRAVHAA